MEAPPYGGLLPDCYKKGNEEGGPASLSLEELQHSPSPWTFPSILQRRSLSLLIQTHTGHYRGLQAFESFRSLAHSQPFCTLLYHTQWEATVSQSHKFSYMCIPCVKSVSLVSRYIYLMKNKALIKRRISL